MSSLECSDKPTITVGILALQGAFIEHEERLWSLGSHIRTRQVRVVKDLDGLDGLIMPGGESTSMGIIAEHQNLWSAIRDRMENGLCIWGTCAGLILLADELLGGIHIDNQHTQPLIGGLAVRVKRNYFGSQQHSFVASIIIKEISPPDPFRAVFIRAPIITDILDSNRIKVLATVTSPENPTEECIVAVQQDNTVLGLAFHPELVEDSRLHAHFVRMVMNKKATLV